MNNRFGEKRNGIEFVHSFFCIKGKCWWLWLGARLHGHAIFGVVSVSDTCRTPVRVRLAWFRCPTSVSFFIFYFLFCFSDMVLTRLRRGFDMPVVEKKRRITDVWPLTSARCRCRCPPSLARARSSRSASYSSLLLLLLLLLFLFLFLCSLTQMPSSSSSSSSASFTFSFSFSFILTSLILFYISFLFYGSSANPTWKSL